MADPAIADRHAGTDQLRDTYAREDLGILLRESARKGARGRQAGLRHGADWHGEIQSRSLVERVDPVEGEAQRADRFEKGIGKRALARRLFAATHCHHDVAHDARHEAIVEPQPQRLRGVAEHLRHTGGRPVLRRQLVRVGHGAGDGQVGKGVGQPRGGGGVFGAGIAPLTRLVVDPQRLPGDGVVVALPLSKNRPLLSVATVDSESPAGLRQALLDHGLREANAFRPIIHLSAGLQKPPADLRVGHLHTHFLQDVK
jgi:hypothetical protein